MLSCKIKNITWCNMNCGKQKLKSYNGLSTKRVAVGLEAYSVSNIVISYSRVQWVQRTVVAFHHDSWLEIAPSPVIMVDIITPLPSNAETAM